MNLREKTEDLRDHLNDLRKIKRDSMIHRFIIAPIFIGAYAICGFNVAIIVAAAALCYVLIDLLESNKLLYERVNHFIKSRDDF
jgi:hypothetical protein